MKNQKGFILIVFVIIGAIVVASATFGIVKYKDEIATNVSKIFNPEVEISNTESTEKDGVSEKSKIVEKSNDTQELQEQLRISELKQNDDCSQAVEIERLEKEIEELKKKPIAVPPPVVSAPKQTPTPTTDNNVLSPKPTLSKNWSELESKYFAEANQNGWINLIITNNLGEKRYYRKEGNLWVRKNNEDEIRQPYVAPPTLNQLTRLIRMCSASPEIQTTCDNPEFMPGYYSNLAFRNGVDKLILQYEDTIFNQQNRNVASRDILPPIQLPSYVSISTPLSYTPLPTFYTPPATYNPPSTGRVEFFTDPRTERIYSSSNGANYFYDLDGRLDHVVGPFGTAHINYDLNGNLNSINY